MPLNVIVVGGTDDGYIVYSLNSKLENYKLISKLLRILSLGPLTITDLNV
jgi:hypothetical protein